MARIVEDYTGYSISQELPCSFENAKTLANFATFQEWSGFPIYPSQDGKMRSTKDESIQENLEDIFDMPDTFGYSYGFTKHLPSIPTEVRDTMKGRFIIRRVGSRVILTWSWTFDISANADKAIGLLQKGASHVQSVGT
eukprot:TRINITY_DN4600_c0_g4_i1.p1 TRINITY_DN4600_c0_g4~~TRINITY_DN4600_c0_g4_i1.p1  ORF type:complete len:139 (+),score=14.57 TRINITY_DN4600_c0_g4_i1:170-586(+)